MDNFKLSDFYSVELRNDILNKEGMSTVRAYLNNVISQLQELVDDTPTRKERDHRFDDVFGTILSSALDYEVLAAYFLNNNSDDISEGGLSENVIRILKELDMRRNNVPFAG